MTISTPPSAAASLAPPAAERHLLIAPALKEKTLKVDDLLEYQNVILGKIQFKIKQWTSIFYIEQLASDWPFD